MSLKSHSPVIRDPRTPPFIHSNFFFKSRAMIFLSRNNHIMRIPAFERETFANFFRNVRASFYSYLDRFCSIVLDLTKESIAFIVWPESSAFVFCLPLTPLILNTLLDVKYFIVPAVPE